MYEQGRAVTKDRVEALKWYRMAADQGNAKAQMEIGVRYAKGWDVEQDYVEAYFWLSLAEKGLTGAPANFADAAAINLTPEQKAAVLKRVNEWKPIPARPPAPAKAETK